MQCRRAVEPLSEHLTKRKAIAEIAEIPITHYTDLKFTNEDLLS